jgi:hypothetical protein
LARLSRFAHRIVVLFRLSFFVLAAHVVGYEYRRWLALTRSLFLGNEAVLGAFSALGCDHVRCVLLLCDVVNSLCLSVD